MSLLERHLLTRVAPLADTDRLLTRVTPLADTDHLLTRVAPLRDENPWRRLLRPRAEEPD